MAVNMKRKIIVIGSMLLLLGIVVLIATIKTGEAVKDWGVGSVERVLGTDTKGKLIILNNNSLLSVENSGETSVLAKEVTDAIISTNNDAIMYFSGLGSNTIVHIRNLLSEEEKTYKGFTNGYWYKNEPYMIKQSGKSFQVYDKNNSTNGVTIPSDSVHQVGENIFVQDINISPEDDAINYVILDASTLKARKKISITPESNPWFSTSYLFFVNGKGELSVISDGGEIRQTGLTGIQKKDITKNDGNLVYYTQYAKDAKNSQLEIMQLDIEKGESKRLFSIPTSKLTKGSANTAEIKDTIFKQNALILVTQEAVWEVWKVGL